MVTCWFPNNLSHARDNLYSWVIKTYVTVRDSREHRWNTLNNTILFSSVTIPVNICWNLLSLQLIQEVEKIFLPPRIWVKWNAKKLPLGGNTGSRANYWSICAMHKTLQCYNNPMEELLAITNCHVGKDFYLNRSSSVEIFFSMLNVPAKCSLRLCLTTLID